MWGLLFLGTDSFISHIGAVLNTEIVGTDYYGKRIKSGLIEEF